MSGQNFHLFKTREEADKKYDELKHAYMVHSTSQTQRGYWVDTLPPRLNHLTDTLIKSK